MMNIKHKTIKSYIRILIVSVLFIYIFSYLQWRTDILLTESEYTGIDKKPHEEPVFLYFSVNDQKTFHCKIYIPAIIIDLWVSGFELVEE